MFTQTSKHLLGEVGRSPWDKRRRSRRSANVTVGSVCNKNNAPDFSLKMNFIVSARKEMSQKDTKYYESVTHHWIKTITIYVLKRSNTI